MPRQALNIENFRIFFSDNILEFVAVKVIKYLREDMHWIIDESSDEDIKEGIKIKEHDKIDVWKPAVTK